MLDKLFNSYGLYSQQDRISGLLWLMALLVVPWLLQKMRAKAGLQMNDFLMYIGLVLMLILFIIKAHWLPSYLAVLIISFFPVWGNNPDNTYQYILKKIKNEPYPPEPLPNGNLYILYMALFFAVAIKVWATSKAEGMEFMVLIAASLFLVPLALLSVILHLRLWAKFNQQNKSKE